MAENIIGLLMEIGADPKKAEAAMAELKASTVAESGEISTLWSGAMEAMTGPTGIALGAIVGLGAGMAELANKAAEAGNQIFEASEKTGMSAESLSGVMALAKETGANFEGLSTAFARGARNIAQAADSGKGALIDLFTQAELQSLKLKPVDEQMQTVLHRIFSLTEAGERNKELQALLGRGWQENVSVLKLLAEQGYAPAIERARQLHVFYDDKAALQARQFTIEMRDLQAQLSGLGLVIGQAVVPKLSEWLAEMHTVSFEVQLLEVGLEAQAISLFNFSHKVAAASDLLRGDAIGAKREWQTAGGVYDKQLQDLALRATDLVTAEHMALLKFKEDIAGLAGGAEGAGGLGGEAGTAAADKTVKTQQQVTQAVKGTQDVFAGLESTTDSAVMSLNLWITELKEPLTELPLLQRDLAALTPVIQENAQAALQHASAIKAAAEAMDSETAATAAGTAIKVAGLIGGRKAAAGVEAVWEVARGIACLAEGTWPPNPAAIAAAGMHFEAAAQYSILAGRSSSHHAGGGASAGAGGSRDSGSAGGNDRSRLPPPDTLADGAQGGRFGSPGSGVVIIHGTQEFENYVAGAVNSAVARGVNVTSTSSQRGSPVGH